MRHGKLRQQRSAAVTKPVASKPYASSKAGTSSGLLAALDARSHPSQQQQAIAGPSVAPLPRKRNSQAALIELSDSDEDSPKIKRTKTEPLAKNPLGVSNSNIPGPSSSIPKVRPMSSHLIAQKPLPVMPYSALYPALPPIVASAQLPDPRRTLLHQMLPQMPSLPTVPSDPVGRAVFAMDDHDSDSDSDGDSEGDPDRPSFMQYMPKNPITAAAVPRGGGRG